MIGPNAVYVSDCTGHLSSTIGQKDSTCASRYCIDIVSLLVNKADVGGGTQAH